MEPRPGPAGCRELGSRASSVRVLVTGATGFVASHLIPALAASGHEVVAVGHDPVRIPVGERVEPIVLDLSTRFPVDDLPAVDAVVHLAQANVRFPDGADALFAVNTAATQRLLEHARRTGATTFVFASSGSVYGMAAAPLIESGPLRATDFYSATKVSAERLVAAYAAELSTWTLRIFVPYGPGQTGRMIPAIANRIRSGEPVQLNDGGRPRMNPIYVADLVDVIAAALTSNGNEVVNVAGDDVVGIRELALHIGEVLGTEPTFVEGDQPVGGDIVADTTHLKAVFPAVARTPLTEGLRRMLGSPEA